MKKFSILLLIMIISIFTLTGCGGPDGKTESGKEYNVCDKVNFIEISNNKGRNDFKVFVHKETKIMYIMYCYGGFCLSVLVDIDGKPLIWEGDL